MENRRAEKPSTGKRARCKRDKSGREKRSVRVVNYARRVGGEKKRSRAQTKRVIAPEIRDNLRQLADHRFSSSHVVDVNATLSVFAEESTVPDVLHQLERSFVSRLCIVR